MQTVRTSLVNLLLHFYLKALVLQQRLKASFHEVIKLMNVLQLKLCLTEAALQLTFMHSNTTVVALDDLVSVLAVVTQADAADEDVLRVPGLGAVQQTILGSQGTEPQ